MQSRHFPLLFALLVAALLGLYGFQAYWLYGSYQMATAEFDRTARQALEAAVQRQQLGQTARLFTTGPAGAGGRVFQFGAPPASEAGPATGPASASSGPAPTVLILSGRVDVAQTHLPGATTQLLNGAAGAAPAPSARADSLAWRLSQLVVGSWLAGARPQLAPLRAAYQAELRRRQIEQPFRLDTLVTQVAVERAGFTRHTPAVPLNPVRGLSVVASFQPPTAYLLRQLAGSLAASVLLLALTTTCFGLMLHTILRQKQLAAIKSDFIHNMTHELKTPLATVSAAAEALQDFGALANPHRADAYLTMARQELQRLTGLVDQVLRIATEERPGQALVLHPQPVRPAELVAELVQRHQLQAPKPVAFEVQIAPTDTLWLDPLHLTGVLHNLFDNAIKYAGAGVAVRVHGQPAPDGGWQLTVADNGPGIAPEYQQAVFEQFFRVPTGDRHPVKGFGLGLYYARQVVAAHGGRLSLRSQPGRGSEFTLWLPRNRAVA